MRIVRIAIFISFNENSSIYKVGYFKKETKHRTATAGVNKKE